MLHLTPQTNNLNPHDDVYQKQEESMLDFRGEVKEVVPRKFIVSSTVSCTADPFLFVNGMKSRVSNHLFSCFHVKLIKVLMAKTL